MAETFADSINGLVFDGQTLRIEFGVTRLDEQIGAALTEAEVVKAAPPQAG
jgi:hypothetical protein